ncbi:MAG TPA: SDR family oxidoreductase [Acidimicrobiales bacterium]|nr:SDR family oxidoreductase [Acidimicrobiales bacterium]
MDGRSALVTGAGRGIGRATALLLARRGAQVMAVSRTEAELDALTKECSDLSGPVQYLVETVETEEGCARIVAETTRRLGKLDILVNNAGYGSIDEAEIWLEDAAVWQRSLAVNLTAPFTLTRLALPEMIERRYGRVVMVGSAASTESGVAARMPAYAATKHGLLGLTRAVALDVAPFGVTCNAVLPGSVRTRTAELKVRSEAQRARTTVDAAWQARLSRYYAGRFVTPAEVAETIAFLASAQASGINGIGLLVALQGAV